MPAGYGVPRRTGTRSTGAGRPRGSRRPSSSRERWRGCHPRAAGRGGAGPGADLAEPPGPRRRGDERGHALAVPARRSSGPGGGLSVMRPRVAFGSSDLPRDVARWLFEAW